MSRTEDELWDMLAQAGQMPDGRAKIAALEAVVLHADAENLTELQYRARLSATRAYNRGGEPAKAIVAFSWCLAARDRGDGNPELDHSLYWYFKWIVNDIISFHQIPLAQAEAVLDDMERRYRLAGHTMGPVHQHREWLARHIGDRAAAEEQYRLWGTAPRGEMSDCAACEPTSRVNHLAWLHRDAEAVAMAETVLNGKITCIEQPQSILTSLLVPYLRTGRLAAAADAHRRAYRAIRGSVSELDSVAWHVQFCALSGNHARGLELVQRHLGWLDEPPNPSAEMTFSAAAARVLTGIAPDTPLLRPAFGDRPVSEVSAAALRDELTTRALEIAALFDKRNGTSKQSDDIQSMLTAEPIVDQLQLSTFITRQPQPQPRPIYPQTPEELADLAERERFMSNLDFASEVWRRFDEVLPEPTGTLLARRLNARALRTANVDPEAAEQDWRRAAELFAEAGDEIRQLGALGRMGLTLCITGQSEAGIAQIKAEIDRLAEIGDAESRSRAWARLASAYMMTSRVEDALDALASARDFAEQTGSLLEQAHVAEESATFYGFTGEHMAEAVQFAARSVALYQAAGATEGLVRAQLLEAQLHARSGDLARAYELLSTVTLPASKALRGELLDMLGALALDLGAPADAYTHLTAAINALVDLPKPAAYAKVRLATACLQLERFAEAAEAAEEAIPELQRIQDSQEAASAQFLLSKAYTELGLSDQALDLLRQVSEHCAADANPAGVGQMRGLAGDLLDTLDRDIDAAKSYAEAAAAYREAEWPVEELTYLRRAALSWHWAKNSDTAQDVLATADELALGIVSDEPHVIWEKTMLGYDGARILAGGDRTAEALIRVTPLAGTFRSLGAATEAAIALTLRGRLLADLGQTAEAISVLSHVLDELPEDATRQRDEVEALLARLRETS